MVAAPTGMTALTGVPSTNNGGWITKNWSSLLQTIVLVVGLAVAFVTLQNQQAEQGRQRLEDLDRAREQREFAASSSSDQFDFYKSQILNLQTNFGDSARGAKEERADTKDALRELIKEVQSLREALATKADRRSFLDGPRAVQPAVTGALPLPLLLPF